MLAPAHLGGYLIVAPSPRRFLLAHPPRNPADLVVIERAIPDVSSDLSRAERLSQEARQNALPIRGVIPLRDAFLARSGGATELCFASPFFPNSVLLSGLLQTARARAEVIPVPIAVAILSELLITLERIHANQGPGPCLHLRLTPAALLLHPDGLLLSGSGVGLSPLPSAWQSDEQRSTFRYMAPEQTRGALLSPRTDVYQAAVIFWEILAGRPRFAAQDLMSLMTQIQHQRPGSLRAQRPDLPEPLDSLLRSALSPLPHERPGSARALNDAMEQQVTRAPWPTVQEWATALGAEPFPGPEVYGLLSPSQEEAPSSAPPLRGPYR